MWFWGPSGYRVVFEKDGSPDGFDRPEPGLNGDLVKTAQGYRLEWFDQSVYVFDEQGRLQVTRDSKGNELNFNYTQDPTANPTKVVKVIDTRGRSMTMDYDSTGSVITGVTARKPDNTPMMGWSYTYAQGPLGAVLTSSELSFVDDAAIGGTATSDDENVGAATAYGYANGTVLNRVVDAREVADPALEAGGSTAVVYDSRKRVVELTRETDEEEVPDSTVRYTYAGNPDAGPNPPCHPIDLLGGQDKEAKTRTNVDGERIEAGVSDITKYCVDVHGRVKRTTDADDKSRATAWTDNSNVDAASMPGVAAGEDLYDYTYDNHDNPTSAKTPEGAQMGAEYTDSENPHSPTKVRGDDTGNEPDKTSWDYTYDEDNNLITAASADGVDGPGIEYRYCWTSRGQIHRIDPVTATGTKPELHRPRRPTPPWPTGRAATPRGPRATTRCSPTTPTPSSPGSTSPPAGMSRSPTTRCRGSRPSPTAAGSPPPTPTTGWTGSCGRSTPSRGSPTSPWPGSTTWPGTPPA